jgi:alanyl-tRNA synthetase
VGAFLITGESSIAAGTRRIEALVGEAASRTLQERNRLLHETAKRLSRSPADVVSGLEELLEQLKQAERERKTLQAELAKIEAQRLVATAQRIKEVAFVQASIKHMDRESLAVLADAVKRLLSGEGIVCLASGDGGTVSMVVAATAGLSKRVHAGNVLKAIAPLVNGSGGGRPDFAQGGGKDAAGIPSALKRAGELIREALDTR